MLIADGEGIRFRHELARRAIEFTDLLRLSYHRQVLAQLVALGAPAPTRPPCRRHAGTSTSCWSTACARHAGGGHGSPPAGRRRRGGARTSTGSSSGETAVLRAGYAYESSSSTTWRPPRPRQRALGLAEGLADPWCSPRCSPRWSRSRLFDLWDGASDMGRRAIELLGDDPPPALEATACVNLASDLVQVDQHGEAASWTERGLGAARRAGRKDLESLCLMYRATSKGWLGDPGGEPTWRRHRAGRGARCLRLRRPRLPQHGGHAVPPGPVGGGAWIDRAVTDSEEAEFFSGLARARSMRGGLGLNAAAGTRPRRSCGSPPQTNRRFSRGTSFLGRLSPGESDRRPRCWPGPRRPSPASTIPSGCSPSGCASSTPG